MNPQLRRITTVGILYIIICVLAAAFVMAHPAWAQDKDQYYSLSDLPDGGLFFATETPGKVRQVTTLKTNVTINVAGPIARTKVEQYFENTSNDFVEAIYTFPLPEDSAVDRLFMTIGDRTVTGEIQEKKKARETFEQARREGKRASLVSQERPNVFSTELTNIAPGDVIKVTIEYQETLMIDANGGAMSFPMVVRPRYNPGRPLSKPDQSGGGWALDTTVVEDASRITPPIADPRLGKINPVMLTVNLEPGFAVNSIDSLSHAIKVDDQGSGKFIVTPQAGTVPADQDFLLTWEASPQAVPQASVFTEVVDNEQYHLMMVMPPKGDENVTDIRPKERIIILDRSGSMGGEAMREAKDAVHFAINQMGPEDKLNIIAFDDKVETLFRDAKMMTPEMRAEAHRFVASINSRGGTEMLPALSVALDGRVDDSRIRQVIFITDGAVGDEESLFRQINTRLGDTKLFTVGIGAAPNSFFMTEAAEAGRGSFTYIADMSEVDRKMQELFAMLESPTFSNIEFNWAGHRAVEMYPSTIADLYKGVPLMISFKAPALHSAPRLTGRISDKEIKIDPSFNPFSSEGVAALWARAKIRDLKREARRDYRMGGDKLAEEGLATALKFSLLSDWTSLVAVDDEVVRKPEDILLEETMATNLPADMDPVMAMAPPRQLALRAPQAVNTQGLLMPSGGTASTLLTIIGLALMLVALLWWYFIGRLPWQKQQ